jgi:hypothetical protein
VLVVIVRGMEVVPLASLMVFASKMLAFISSERSP